MEYLRQGAFVAINHLGINEEGHLEALKAEAQQIIGSDAVSTRLIAVAGDISKPETGTHFVAKTVEAFSRLDVFVSNAGVCQFAEFLE